MTIPERCDTSTTVAGFTEKLSKLPPGGGRAAAGGSAKPKRAKGLADPAKTPRGTVWVAVTYLGGANLRYRVQMGKTVRFVTGLHALHDVLTALADPAGQMSTGRL